MIRQLFSSPQKNPEYDSFMMNSDPYAFPYLYTSLTEPKYVFPTWVTDQILLLFSYQIAPELEEKCRLCFVTDTTDIMNPVTVCNKDLFMLQTPEEERLFYSQFVLTMQFDTFCNRITSEFENQKTKMLRFSSTQISCENAPPKSPTPRSMTRSRSTLEMFNPFQDSD